MREGSIRIKALILDLIQLVHTIREYLIFYIFQIIAGHYGLKLDAELVGKLTPLGEKLKAHVGYFAILVFAIYDKVILVCHFSNIMLPDGMVRNKFFYEILKSLVVIFYLTGFLCGEYHIFYALYLGR